jgi:peptidoglycan/LPS O-acetylase OafA/YrhL
LPVSQTKPVKFGYLPGLDGWRAIAILCVIFYHSDLLRIGFFSTSWLWSFGYRGVDVFFAISGLLITSRLLVEEKRLGKISVRDFYVRRAFRILPPALFYLAAIAALTGLKIIHVDTREWFAAAFFYRNYSSFFHIEQTLQLPWFTTHFWSLSIEEHFYLLLPALLVFCRGRARMAALGLISVAVIVHRQLELAHRSWQTIQFHSDTRLDALLIPAIFAVLWQSDRFGASFTSWVKRWHLAFVAVFLGFICWQANWGIQQTAISIAAPGVVLGTVLKPSGLATRILEWRLLRWIGRISYSLYLWQELFFTNRFLEHRPLGFAETWPVNLALTFLMAALSYFAIERPLIRVGHRLTRGVTTV